MEVWARAKILNTQFKPYHLVIVDETTIDKTVKIPFIPVNYTKPRAYGPGQKFLTYADYFDVPEKLTKAYTGKIQFISI